MPDSIVFFRRKRWFDEAYYLKAKLAQLKAVGEKDGNGNDYTLTTLKKAIADNGMTPEEHYNAYGRSEGVNPNAYFNEAEYLQAKLEQLHSVNETDAHGNPYTLTTLKEAIANIGLTPSNNGEHIRLNIPPLTEERRKELVKQIKAETETARVSLRGIRRDLVDAFKKAQKDGMPEDAAKDGEESAQKLTDKYAKKVDDLFSAKEKEIMTV